MEGTVRVRAGWGSASLVDASPSLRARCAAADAEERREAARLERERSALRAQLEADSIAASCFLAEQRGELLTRQDRLNGVGRTKAEAIAFYSAQADLEDARIVAARAKRLRELEVEESAAWSGDLTAGKSPHDLEMGARAAKFRSKLAEELRWRKAAVAEARQIAAYDRRRVNVERRWA